MSTTTVVSTKTPVYLGIDIGKKTHAWCLLSGPLLKSRKTYQRCPSGSIGNARAEFERLLSIARAEAGNRTIHIVCEHTGHYGYALEQFFAEQTGTRLYRVQAAKRMGRDKTDKKDAQGLAAKLYNQVSLRIQVTDEHERVTCLHPPIPEAVQLRPLVQHRIELMHEIVQRENRLTALADQLFPELTVVYKDPNTPSALSLRESFPTAQAVAEAPIGELIATRAWTRPSNESFRALQALARESIGLKRGPRQDSLIVEQRHLIREVALLRQHEAELDNLIETILADSREAKILTSFPGVGPVLAAQLLAGIGSIANFETVGKFRAYVGWAPRRSQTGTTYDSSSQDRSGNRLCKQAMRQAAVAAVRHSPRWRALLVRLLTKPNKMGAMGRIAGQLAGVIYLLLKRDAEVTRRHQGSDEPLPAPQLYDAHIHG